MNFMLLVARAISHSFAGLTREILFLPLEHKIHIFSPPCNILYLLKTGSLDNAIREFSLVLLSWYMSHYTMIYKKWWAYAWFFGPFCFYCSLVFYILEAFLIKQLFHSRLLDRRWLYPTRRYVPRWLSIISYPTRAHGIIINYNPWNIFARAGLA